MKIVTSIASLALQPRAWLVDIWGVLHNGVAPFDDAVVACETFRRQGGIVLLVSNAPRPHDAVCSQLDMIGVPREAYDAVLSSGDISRGLITALGPIPIFHVGPPRDRPLFDGLEVVLSQSNAAAAIVCTGLVDDETETPQTYTSVLTACAARDVPMICANPDLAVARADRIIPCAGAVAAYYEQLGGRVTYAGKPHEPIYAAALARIDSLAGETVPKAQILAIGDGVATDIAGAARVRIASVYIASRVHLQTELSQAALEHLFPDPAARPVAAMTALAW